MRKLSLICLVLFAVVVCGQASVFGQYPQGYPANTRVMPVGSMGPSRGLFGLPVPQAWSGARPSSVNPYGPYQGRFAQGGCVGGQCAMGACANGQCATGNCANGQCVTGSCANGQCVTGSCVNGQCATGNCPNGRCATGSYPIGSRYQDTTGWVPRSARTRVSDPFRDTNRTSADNDGWTETRRPVYGPLNDSLRSSGYSRDTLDLRSDYFGRVPAEYNDRAPSRERSAPDSWSRRNSGRSLEVPVENHAGVSRI